MINDRINIELIIIFKSYCILLSIILLLTHDDVQRDLIRTRSMKSGCNSWDRKGGTIARPTVRKELGGRIRE